MYYTTTKITSRLAVILFFISAMLLFFTYNISTSSLKSISCTSAMSTVPMSYGGTVFHGTVTVKLNNGEGIISLYGVSNIKLKNRAGENRVTYRNSYFKYKSINYGTFKVYDVRYEKHPLDNISNETYDNISFDIINLRSTMLHVRKINNAYLFGDQPIPSFMCVTKSETDY